MSNTTRVFVYGTLKQGYGNHRVAEPFVEQAETGAVDGFVLYDGGFPMARPAAGRRVRGELLTLRDPETALRRLDMLEGTPTLYTRERVVVALDSGRKVGAWMYVFTRALENDPDMEPMPGDTWSPAARQTWI
jgi:gamma-glutamylaminecyclotransferase